MLQLIVEFRDVSSLKMSRGCYFPVLLFFELSVFKFKLEISLLYTRALMSLLIFGYLSEKTGELELKWPKLVKIADWA